MPPKKHLGSASAKKQTEFTQPPHESDDMDIESLAASAADHFYDLCSVSTPFSAQNDDTESLSNVPFMARIHASDLFESPFDADFGSGPSLTELNSSFVSSSMIRSTVYDPVNNLEKQAGSVEALMGERKHAPTRKDIKEQKRTKVETAGRGWYDLPATPLTEELKNDFRLLRLKGYLSKDKFVHREKGHRFPKYFQVGVEVGGAADMNSGLLVKPRRAQSFAEQILNDSTTRSYLKKRLLQQEEKMKPKSFATKRKRSQIKERKAKRRKTGD